MIETWRDSWFEHGSRLIYIVPRAEVDKLLPMTIAPAPVSLERVFVGRVELLPHWRKDRIESALKGGDLTPLHQNRRFLNSFLGLIARESGRKVERSAAAEAYLHQIWSTPRRQQ